MDEQNTQATETTPTQAETTPSTAVNVDIEAITAKAAEQAEKKMEAVFKSMLQQQGLDTETINSMTAEWKAKQKTPEQAAKEKEEEIIRLTGELETVRNERIAAGKGVPDERISAYVRLAAGYDGKTFAEKLDAAIKDFPLAKETPPPMAAGTGTANMSDPVTDEFQKRIDKYRG